MVMHVELQATCSALGYQEGNKYVKEPDCLESIKDLVRFLKREDESCDIRRQLGHAQIVQNDLLPILIQYNGDDALFETVIRLLVNLTQPAVLCFSGHIPEDKALRNYYLEVESHLQSMKEVFINEELFAVLTGKLGDLLKLDWEHRHEEHRLLIERLLILIRNILHIPPNSSSEQRTDDDASIHDQILWALHVSGFEDVLLYMASSEEERNLSMHVLEIVSLVFREQTAEMLASAGVGRSVTEKERDERELEMVREQERNQRKCNLLQASTRHSRFGGTYVVKNFKSISDNDLIYHKSQNQVTGINLHINKKPKKKPKNRKPQIEREVVRRSTLSVRLALKEFCIQFLENCYNPLMYAVKDVLNREKSEAHDETYYLWAMRFFMEFCRLHNRQVDLISETLSVQAFHYIQVQLCQYYEMQMMEKKEAIVWGKRTHLALKAYQELLLTLDSMDKSGNTTLMESSKVIKSNIFYMMEFRDIFLTLLRHFDQNRQSRSYLKDLVETTHLFLKMLEHFSNSTGHLIVQKMKRKSTRKKNTDKDRQSDHQPNEQELADLWDEISRVLSAIFQGHTEVPEDVTPFDAASEVDIDQQRVNAMILIQNLLRDRQPERAVALFRAAREVWPDKNEFGAANILPEDEFMALREIFMTNLPRPSAVLVPEKGVEDELEEEEEETVSVETVEQEFVFRDFIVKFAKPEIMKPYILLMADFHKNLSHTNHCCVKMLHRIAVDLGYVGMMFQLSLFRVFQKILLNHFAKAEQYKEIARFATYIVRKFVEVAEKNKKVFMEMLFWKTSKESVTVVEGYGCCSQSKVKELWTEDAETELRRLFEEYNIQDKGDKDTVDCIMERITDPNKTRAQIIRELKRQELITSAKDLRQPKCGVRAGLWKEEEELELKELYNKHRDADDPVGSIMPEMFKKRSRPKVMEKLATMGLVSDRKELYKKRKKYNGTKLCIKDQPDDDEDQNKGFQELPSDIDNDPMKCDSSSSDDNDLDGIELEHSAMNVKTMTNVLGELVRKGYKDQIAWIQRCLVRTADDRDVEGETVPVPIVPLTEENETAMEDEVFITFLKMIGLTAPANEQEAFWRIPMELSTHELQNIVSGLVLNENGEPVASDKIVIRNITANNKTENKKRKGTLKKRKNASQLAALKQLIRQKTEKRKSKRTQSDDTEESDTTEAHMNKPADSSVRLSKRFYQKRLRKLVPSNIVVHDDEMSLEDIADKSMPGDDVENQSNGSNQLSNGDEAENQSNGTNQLLNFLSSSDEEGDNDGVVHGNKRSRSVDSDLGSTRVKKKVRRLLDSDSDSDVCAIAHEDS